MQTTKLVMHVNSYRRTMNTLFFNFSFKPTQFWAYFCQHGRQKLHLLYIILLLQIKLKLIWAPV